MKRVMIHVLIVIAAVSESSAKVSTLPARGLPSMKPEKSEKEAQPGCAESRVGEHLKGSLYPKHVDVKVKARGLVHLSCGASKVGEDKNMKWLRGHQIIWSEGCWHGRKPDRFQVLENGTLQIENAQATDGHLYQCTARNNTPLAYNLCVVGPLELTMLPEGGEVTVYVGQPFQFGCNASGCDRPEFTVTNLNTSIVLPANRDGIVQLDSAQKVHSGLYRCKVTISWQEDTCDIRVTVLDPPGEGSPAISKQKVAQAQNSGMPSPLSVRVLVVLLFLDGFSDALS